MTLVGWGNNNNETGEGYGVFRKGTNTLLVSAADDYIYRFITFSGAMKQEADNPTGIDSSAGAGDSGGPLFLSKPAGSSEVPNETIGVTSGGSGNTSVYVDLGKIRSKLFFLYLTRIGADINIPIETPFFNGVRNLPYGTYEDVVEKSCKVYVVDADLFDQSPELEINFAGCEKSRQDWLLCDEKLTRCSLQSQGTSVISHFDYKTFEWTNGSSKRKFNFTLNKTEGR
ncbi:MAG: hypothetical protein AB7F87_00605 [Oligoflexales bacterium]